MKYFVVSLIALAFTEASAISQGSLNTSNGTTQLTPQAVPPQTLIVIDFPGKDFSNLWLDLTTD